MGVWLRVVAWLVPGYRRGDWIEEWKAELAATQAGFGDAWGALADAWFLRTEGWTMGAMIRDVRMAVRSLARKPFFTALAGITLAVGIGANTAIYSVVDAILINPLPLYQPERVVSYNHDAPGLGVSVPVVPHSEAMYLHYLENARALQAFAVYTDDNINLVSDGEPQRLGAAQVTRQYFDVMGIQPFLGRGFVEGEDRPGAEPVAILGYPVWEQTFGADRDILGSVVEMDGVLRRIVGVMPEHAAFTDEELWVPLVIDPSDMDVGSLSYIGLGRLTEGATVESANVEMQDLLLRFAQANPDELPTEVMEQAGLVANVRPLKDVFVEDLRGALWVLLGTVGFVLLIACANVANLFLVRAEARQREVAVRTAMGASRLDVIRQYLAESITLAAGGGLLGLGLAALGVQGLLKLTPPGMPRALEVGMDGSVLAFTAIISLVSGVIFGLFPVFRYGRRDLSNALKDGGRASTTGRERHRAQSGLVVAQVALALVLLVGSGLMFRSFVALRGVDPGFDADGALTFRFALPSAEYPDARQALSFHRRLTDELSGLPGVQAVGMIGGLPLTQSTSAGPLEPEDRPYPEGELARVIERRAVTPGLFEALGVPILEGRGLVWSDQADEYAGVVIGKTLADLFWPGESAVGRRLRGQGSDFSWEVVGVVGDIRHSKVQEEPVEMLYMPAIQGNAEETIANRSLDVVLKLSGDPLASVVAAREALRAVDGRLPMIAPRTLQAVVDESMAPTSFTVLLLGISAGIALLLGTVGIYGVISYVVSRRTQEIGVRMALGAPAGTVLRDVVGRGMVLAGLGVAIGLVGAWGVSRVLTSLLYGVSATDPLTYVGTALVLSVVAGTASYLPARRASRVDPVEALRGD